MEDAKSVHLTLVCTGRRAPFFSCTDAHSLCGGGGYFRSRARPALSFDARRRGPARVKTTHAIKHSVYTFPQVTLSHDYSIEIAANARNCRTFVFGICSLLFGGGKCLWKS